MVDASNARFDTNGNSTTAGHGASIGAGGTFTASLSSFNSNRGPGVHVSVGGTATLLGGSANGNGAGALTANGLEVEGAGSLTVNRGTVI